MLSGMDFNLHIVLKGDLGSELMACGPQKLAPERGLKGPLSLTAGHQFWG